LELLSNRDPDEESATSAAIPLSSYPPWPFNAFALGSAPIGIENIAPFDGGVVFRMYIFWDDPLPVWTDILIADEFPQGFIRA
jgi:hypothetical protein